MAAEPMTSPNSSTDSTLHGSHCSVTHTGANPWNDISTSVKDDTHAYQSPTPTDSRSPCPALNTLANHGYLPRNGRDITRTHLLHALQHPHTYRLSPSLAGTLVHGGFLLMHAPTAGSTTLHALARHGRIEHDASVVHRDAARGCAFAPTRCDARLLARLLDAEEVLTVERLARRRVVRERGAPLGAFYQAVARGEWALVMDIFGRAHGGEVPSGLLRVWLGENRFPEGWEPTHEQGLGETIVKAGEIRRAMRELESKLHKVEGGMEEEEEEEEEFPGEWTELTTGVVAR